MSFSKALGSDDISGFDFVKVNIVGQNYREDDFFRKVKTLRAFCQKVVSFYDGILERLVK